MGGVGRRAQNLDNVTVELASGVLPWPAVISTGAVCRNDFGSCGFGCCCCLGECLRRRRTHFRGLRRCRSCILARQRARFPAFGAQVPALAIGRPVRAVIPVTALRRWGVRLLKTLIGCASPLNSHNKDGGDRKQRYSRSLLLLHLHPPLLSLRDIAAKNPPCTVTDSKKTGIVAKNTQISMGVCWPFCNWTAGCTAHPRSATGPKARLAFWGAYVSFDRLRTLIS